MEDADLAVALREICTAQGWSTTVLAYEAGVSTQAAFAWLSGQSKPSAHALLRLLRKHMVVRERLLGAA